MPSLDDLGHDEFELLARIAHRYYADGLTQEALAREFGLSRPKVQRLLDRARAAGVVDIRIATPPWLHLDLERSLRERFGLAEVIVAPARADADAQRAEVARAAAMYLERRLDDGAVVAVSHGRDTGEVPRFFTPRRPLGGDVRERDGRLVRWPTRPRTPTRSCAASPTAAAARPWACTRPRPSRARGCATSSLREPAVAEALGIAARASVALVGIGGVDDDCTMVRSGSVSLDEIRRLRDAGAVGDVLGNYVDADGGLVRSPDTARLVGLSLDELHAIDTVVVVVSEAEKPLAILGVLRTGVVDVLVIDEGNARFLVEPGREATLRPLTEV